MVPLWILSSWGMGQPGQKAEECLKGQINEQSEGRLWMPIQVLGKCLSVVWWKGPEGESGSTCPLPPAAGGLKNNEESARQWHVGGSWLQLTENRPFVLFSANVDKGPHAWWGLQSRTGRQLHLCVHVCERWRPPSLLSNQLSLLNKLPIRIAYDLSVFSSW